ncbi:MAG: cation diffusion facilitator family transporter [Actinomycetia bacterium]|nr:cation diffusion facilitator family transporter [Actinomycetes bacterium]
MEIGERSAWWGIASNALLTAVKVAAGVAGRSQALLADGIHSGADVGSSIAVLVGLRIARQPPDAEHNYGHHKAEAVAQKVVAVLLVLAGLDVMAGAASSLGRPPTVEPDRLALAVAVAAGVAKGILYVSQRALARRLRSHALGASAVDNLTDLVSSAAAVGGILGARMGWAHADAWGALLVGALVIAAGVRLFGQAASHLMDRAVDAETAELLRRQALAVPGVLAVKEIRTRLAGPIILVDIKVVAPRTFSLVEAHSLAHAVKDRLMDVPHVADVMVHVNPSPEDAAPPTAPRTTHGGGS